VADKIILEWAAGDGNIGVFNPGAYSFECALEASGSIFYYRIDENDGED
jgi:hypothetical protein